MWIIPWDPFLIKKLLKSEICGSRDWKIAEKVTLCALFTPQSQQSRLAKKKKVENIDMNAGKHKTRFPNAHLGYAKSKKKKKKKIESQNWITKKLKSRFRLDFKKNLPRHRSVCSYTIRSQALLICVSLCVSS